MKREANKKRVQAGRGKNAAPAAVRPPRGNARAAGAFFSDFEKFSWLLPVALIALVLVCYAPALRGGYLWDDDQYISENALLHSLRGLRRIWFSLTATPQYYPLVFTTFWTEFHLWGIGSSIGYHIDNALLHAGSAALLWLALRRLRVRGAWLAGLLFALHPVAAESVAWMTERKNVLSTFFYLLSLLALIRFYRLGEQEENPSLPKNFFWRAYPFALVFFVCALLSKTVACSLPVAILIVLWWKRGRVRLGEALATIPFFAVGSALGLLTAWVEKMNVGAQGVQWALSPLDRCLIAGRAVWFYLGKLLWPAGLIFSYPRWEIDPHAAWQYLFPLALLALIAALWFLRGRIGRGPLAALLFFIASLFPALGFVDVYPMQFSFVADHFQYLAMLGPLALVAALWCGPVRDRFPGKLTAVPALCVLAALGALTFREGFNYKDKQTLWKTTLERNPQSWLAMSNLGSLMRDTGRYDEALVYLTQALKTNPKIPKNRSNMGIVLADLHRDGEARDQYLQAIALDPANPASHFDYASFLAKRNKVAEAEVEYREALKYKPVIVQAHHNLAVVLTEQGKTVEAIEQYKAAIERNPDLALAYPELAKLYFGQGKLDLAIATLQDALRINSGDSITWFMLSNYLEQAKRGDEGRQVLLGALRQNPTWVPIALNLSWIQATSPVGERRNGPEAVRLAEIACEAGGGKNPQGLDTLAAAYAEAGRFNEAIQAAQAALAQAQSAGEASLAAALDARIKLYQSHRPYHEPAGAK